MARTSRTLNNSTPHLAHKQSRYTFELKVLFSFLYGCEQLVTPACVWREVVRRARLFLPSPYAARALYLLTFSNRAGS